jgi:hypothetical protein
MCKQPPLSLVTASEVSNLLLLIQMVPLFWWKVYGKQFPLLSKLAGLYLAIPAAEVERLFSASGGIITASVPRAR